MTTLRNAKKLTLFGMLAVALAATLMAAPTAEAGGCGGYGYGYAPTYVHTYHAPVVTHYVAPVYPTVKYVTHSNYYTPTYVPTGHYGW